jgi:hypothetical protein
LDASIHHQVIPQKAKKGSALLFAIGLTQGRKKSRVFTVNILAGRESAEGVVTHFSSVAF